MRLGLDTKTEGAGVKFLSACLALLLAACVTSNETDWKLLRGESTHVSAGGIFDEPLPVKVLVLIDGVPASKGARFSFCERALGIDSYDADDWVESDFQHEIEDLLLERGVIIDENASMRILYDLLLIDNPHDAAPSKKDEYCLGRLEVSLQDKGRIGLGEDGPIVQSNRLINLFHSTELFYSHRSNIRYGFYSHIHESVDRMAKTLIGEAKLDCEKFALRPEERCAQQLHLELIIKRDVLQCNITDKKRAEIEAEINELEAKLSEYPPMGEVSERFTFCLKGEECRFCDKYEIE